MQSHSREATGTVTPFDKYAESKSRSDCCAVTVAKLLLPHLLIIQSHSREATVMPRRRGVAASIFYFPTNGDWVMTRFREK